MNNYDDEHAEKLFQERYDWGDILKNNRVSEQFIEKHREDINWDAVVIFVKLSEDFLIKNRDYINWQYVSVFQELSMQFICKYKEELDLSLVSLYQNLSREFIFDNLWQGIDLVNIFRNERIDIEIKKSLIPVALTSCNKKLIAEAKEFLKSIRKEEDKNASQDINMKN